MLGPYLLHVGRVAILHSVQYSTVCVWSTVLVCLLHTSTKAKYFIFARITLEAAPLVAYVIRKPHPKAEVQTREDKKVTRVCFWPFHSQSDLRVNALITTGPVLHCNTECVAALALIKNRASVGHKESTALWRTVAAFFIKFNPDSENALQSNYFYRYQAYSTLLTLLYSTVCFCLLRTKVVALQRVF